MFQRTFLSALFLAVLSHVVHVSADHTFTFINSCDDTITPAVANVNCRYSARCDTPGSGGVPNPAISYTGPQPKPLGPGESESITINRQWNGRIFAQHGACGPHGEACSIGEFNLDTGNESSPQTYDLSNIEGFTQPLQIAVNGCDTVTCADIDCGCSNAYPIGDLSGCGNDAPVRGCSAGDHHWTITFCP